MKILHVTPFYEPAWAYGGMARSSAALCRALARNGHEVTVATALLEPGHPLDERVGGVRVRRFAGPALAKRFLVPWAWGLRDFLRAELPAVHVAHLHGHRNGLAMVASQMLTAAGRPWVLQPCGTFPHHGQYPVVKALFDGAFGKRIVRRVSAMIAVSEAEARDLPRPACVVPNGVEACGEPPRTEKGTRPRLLFVGTDRPQKRGHLLPRLLAALPEVELHLAGRFGSRFLDVFAPFATRTTLCGVLSGDALAAAYAQADVVVHPSIGEAFGLVPFEAALAGTAAVVAGGHGCGEWYGRAGGCVVPPDDIAALTDAVRVRLADEALARREAEAVAAFTRDRLTWDKAALATLAVYQEVQGDPK